LGIRAHRKPISPKPLPVAVADWSGRDIDVIWDAFDPVGYPYGPTPGLVSFARTSGGRSAGDYWVTYPGMAIGSSTPLSVNVTSFGWGIDTCEVGGWRPSGGNGFARIFCFDENNNPVDEQTGATHPREAGVLASLGHL
jgi:hypothetical protein